MRRSLWSIVGVALLVGRLSGASAPEAGTLRRLQYNHPGLVVDLGVGLWAWPLPMDFDGDGDLDLVVSCPDKPYNGTYFFENPDGRVKMPVFRPAVRISRGLQNVQISYEEGQPKILTPGRRHHQFTTRGLDTSTELPVSTEIHTPEGPIGNRIRANQWKYCDYDGDDVTDLIVGIGDWSYYGWDDAYDARGQWTNGPLKGFVYWLRNTGSNQRPVYAPASKVFSHGEPISVYGRPSPNFADFDGDGDLDLLCGEFLDQFSYFENVGSRQSPRYAAPRRLTHNHVPIAMDLQMIAPTAVDWDDDGDVDLIVGDEDGRVALVEHAGRVVGGLPQFLPPKYFQQQAQYVKFGALVTPCGFDWDGDGDDDLVCGNTAGYIGWFENLGLHGNQPEAGPRWSAPRYLRVDGEPIRIQAGANGSIQGPCEAKWGYTTLTVADWDHDQRPDLVVNSIWGKVLWYRNTGTRQQAKLMQPEPIQVQWRGEPPKPAWNWWDPEDQALVTQWRTTPVVVDWNRDGLHDLVMLDHEGYLALFPRSKRDGELWLLPGQRVFVDEKGQPWRLNSRRAGGSGRRKLAATDWDGDGRMDFLVNSQNADWLRNVQTRDGKYVLKNMGPLDPRPLAGHTSSPTVVDWNRDGVPELLVGAEDGYLYYQSTNVTHRRE